MKLQTIKAVLKVLLPLALIAAKDHPDPRVSGAAIAIDTAIQALKEKPQ